MIKKKMAKTRLAPIKSIMISMFQKYLDATFESMTSIIKKTDARQFLDFESPEKAFKQSQKQGIQINNKLIYNNIQNLL